MCSRATEEIIIPLKTQSPAFLNSPHFPSLCHAGAIFFNRPFCKIASQRRYLQQGSAGTFVSAVSPLPALVGRLLAVPVTFETQGSFWVPIAATLIDYLADLASLSESIAPETARLCNAIRLVCSLQNLVSKKRSWRAADVVAHMVIFPSLGFFPPRSCLDVIQIPSESKAQKSAPGNTHEKTVAN